MASAISRLALSFNQSVLSKIDDNLLKQEDRLNALCHTYLLGMLNQLGAHQMGMA